MGKLQIDPYPGTPNLPISHPRDLKRLKSLKKREGIGTAPAETGFVKQNAFMCSLVCRKVRGALIMSQVPDYTESNAEITAKQQLRDALCLTVGDRAIVEIL